MSRVIVTLVGKDHPGIIAAVCNYFAENNINILDIKQTTVQEFINMMMIVDVSKCRKPFEAVASDLGELGLKMGLKIRCQKSEIFEKMHRV